MRFCLKLIGLVLAALALALAALPYWLGAVLPQVGKRMHLSYHRYQREGYGRFVLLNPEYRHGAVRVTADRVEADTPLLWAWRHLRGTDRLVAARNWSVQVLPSAPPLPGAGPSKPVGLAPLHGHLEKVAALLRRWFPRAQAVDGSVHWRTGGFRLAEADWRQAGFAFKGLAWSGGLASGAAFFGPGNVIRFQAAEPDRDWKVDLTWEGPDVEGTAAVWSQPIQLSAQYGPEGWLPVKGRAAAQSWRLTPEQLHLSEKSYREVRGSARADWDGSSFSISAHAAAKAATSKAPPLQADVAIHGDRHHWIVQALKIELPYARVVLDRPVSFGYGANQAPSQASVDLSADLASLPLSGGRGKVSGHAVLEGHPGELPSAQVRLTAVGAAWGKLPAGDYVITGSCDFQRETVSQLNVAATWKGSEFAAWLPKGSQIDRVTASAVFDGSWYDLRHRGTARIEGIRIPSLRTDGAEVTWTGHQWEIDQFQARIAAGPTALVAKGAVNRGGVRFTDLRFEPGGKEALHLATPADIRWTPKWLVAPTSLEGASSKIGGSLSPAGITAEVTNFPGSWLRAVVNWQGPDFKISGIHFAAHWADGRLVFSAQAAAQASTDEGPIQAELFADSDGRKILLHKFQVRAGGEILGDAEGELPVAWDTTTRTWAVNPTAPLHLRVQLDPRSSLWTKLAAQAGFTLTDPEGNAVLDGTLNHPEGKLHLSVAHLGAAPNQSGWQAPTLDGLDIEAHADRSAILLDRLTGAIMGQPIAGSGRLPMGDVRWRQLVRRQGGIPWKEAEGRLDVADADVETMARILPSFLMPRGHWSLHAHLAGGTWNGKLHLEGLALRPVAPIGLVDNITGDVVGAGRTLSIAGFSATIGGDKLFIDGKAELPSGKPPIYSLSLHADSIPLVRQANLLVRASLDLRAQPAGGATQVTGRVVINDGLLLGELSDLLPGGMTGGARPPPYFSISALPFRDWRLDVALSAARSLRAQTPLFSGKASASFQLLGTLGDPRAVGKLTVNSGQISLPFASFDVRLGTVRLTADDPFHPQIEVQATARRYDYDLRLLASGSADKPTLSFTSNPALPSDQILALVMAGQSPQSGGLMGASETQATDLGAYVGESLFSGLSGKPSSNRLSVTSGQELSVTGKPTYEVEYRVGRKWWLEGEYDIFDDYNAGVKWRVYSKGGEP